MCMGETRSNSVVKKCKVVRLPTTSSTDTWGGIVSDERGNLFYLHAGSIAKGHVPQHLYLVSDDEIREGDWVYVESIDKDNHIAQSNTANRHGAYETFSKIIASTDPSLKLPGISQSFLHEYVKAQGRIDEVELETNRMLHDCIYKDAVEHNSVTAYNKTLKLMNNEVIISKSIPEEVYDSVMSKPSLDLNEEDLMKEMSKSDLELEQTIIKLYPMFDGMEDPAGSHRERNAFKAGWEAHAEKCKSSNCWTDDDIMEAFKMGWEANDRKKVFNSKAIMSHLKQKLWKQKK